MKVAFIIDGNYRRYVASVEERVLAKSSGQTAYFATNEVDQILSNIDDFDILVTIHSVSDNIRRLFTQVKGRIPTLTIQDGIIEHQHCWDKNRQGIQRYRPILSDKIAVFGDRSRALLLAWGASPNQIVVTGAPRFDEYMAGDSSGKGPILLTCANTPFFEKSGETSFFLIFEEIIKYLGNANVAFRLRFPEKVRKRALAWDGCFSHLKALCMAVSETNPLVYDLTEARAVVTTVSTVAVEAMLLGKPTALVHPQCSTVYLSSPWNIRCEADIASVVRDLMEPPEEKMIYQSIVLNENLLVGSNATANVVRLMEEMVAASRSAVLA